MTGKTIKLVFFGPPGSGKGTYASRISPKLGIPAISTGDIFRAEVKKGSELGRKAEAIMKSGALMPDEITIGIFANRIKEPDAAKGYLADGFPRTIPQVEWMQKHEKVDAVINLVVPENVIIARLSARESCRKCGKIFNKLFLKPKVAGVCDACGGELYTRDDDKPEAIRERLRAYEKQTAPLLGYYHDKTKVTFINVECNEVDIPPEIMVDKIMKELSKKKIV